MSDLVRCRIDEIGPDGPKASELTGLQGVVETRRVDEVGAVILAVEAAVRSGRTAAGFVSYDAAPAFDPAMTVFSGPPRRDNADLPLAWFGLFSSSRPVRPVSRSAGAAPTGATSPSRPDHRQGPAERARWECDIDRSGYETAHRALQRAIANGDTYLTNYTTRFRRPWPAGESPWALYEQLVRRHAGGLQILLETSDWIVACGSPELFFTMEDRAVTVRPMKGTARRGRWSGEDRMVATALEHSPKERAENVMVVDLVRNDLGRVAVPGTVGVPVLGQSERHPGLWQLSSTVTATLDPDAGLYDVFGALFPCASVTGAPKISTMGQIAGLETSSRGVYCGAVGVLGPRAAPDGSPDEGRPGEDPPAGLDARFAVAIRTAVVDRRRGVAEYGTGGGITCDSRADEEWDELLVKARVLVETGTEGEPPPVLLETMRFDPTLAGPGNPGVRNLERHLGRLRSSASYFGGRFPDDLVGRIGAATEGTGPARIRLLLDLTGAVTVEVHPEDEAIAPAEVRFFCVDDQPVDAGDFRLFHKTTNRWIYEDRTARHPGADDVVLVNDRHEVTETTRANLAVRLDGKWWTPPLACGLLPGVERSRLIDAGVLHERVIPVDELFRAEGLASFSSLRGWLPATVQACPHAG